MKSKLKFFTSGLSICFLLMLLRPAHAEEPAMVQLESVLNELSGYSYGEPETWKPELLESMREIYQDPGLYDRALRRLKDFQNSSVSD
ncbi:MAG: hypothetical protein KJT03_12590, partial [Verrucomicrobiae bacterium]|nr:hypothetical protein [Verrucomicrobiae bacterium]